MLRRARMPPITKEAPKALQPYLSYGVSIDWREGSDEAVGECPFCLKEGKFSVNIESGLWRCLSCNDGSKKSNKVIKGGNIYVFLQRLWDKAKANEEGIRDLAFNRSLLLPEETLRRWGVRRSPICFNWMIPAYNVQGKLVNISTYEVVPGSKPIKMRLRSGTGLNHGIYGMRHYDPDKPYISWHEGPWDAMAAEEVLRCVSLVGDKIVAAQTEDVSLLKDTNVLATPSANVFRDEWRSIFSGKKVHLYYDNDHEKINPKTNQPIPPAGINGMKRVAQLLAAATEPPESVHYIHWGDNGYNPDLPHGFDVRDWLSKDDNGVAITSIKQRGARLRSLRSMLLPIPEDWVAGRNGKAVKKGSLAIECVHCDSWKELVLQWRRAMKWIEGLDRALSILLASIVSTDFSGNQLWIKLVGPPSCGKTTLCEAISVARKYVLPKDTTTGIFSGFQADPDGEKDFSLAALMNGKTLVIKDADTILKSPCRDQILSQLRALYDRNVRTSYKNNTSRNYEDQSTTVVLSGTSAMYELDAAELGARFVDVRVMDDIDDDLENEIAMKQAIQAVTELGGGGIDQVSGGDSPEYLKAKQLTGGYVNHLRKNHRELLSQVSFPADKRDRCLAMGKLISYMRARPSTKQDEKAERELSARLVGQFVRLAMCLAAVMNKDTVDEEIMRRITKTMWDTAHGKTLQICTHLFAQGTVGSTTDAVATAVSSPEDKIRKLLSFLRTLGVVEFYQKPAKGLVGYKVHYRLTTKLMKIFKEVNQDGTAEEDEE